MVQIAEKPWFHVIEAEILSRGRDEGLAEGEAKGKVEAARAKVELIQQLSGPPSLLAQAQKELKEAEARLAQLTEQTSSKKNA